MEWGNKIAVLIGDYILSQAMRCVVDEETRSIPIILSTAADKLIVGEISELDYSGNLDLSFDCYMDVISGKTAALVDACARIGAILAGHDAAQTQECGEMGVHYGIAFQIIDDLLDYGVGAKDLDKAKFTDLSNGLVTLPLIFFFNHCSEDDRKSMESYIHHSSDPEISQEITELLKRYGCFDLAKDTALSHLDAAIALSKKLPHSEFMETLVAFFLSMSDRHN
jgi:geranylgeranyl pyrophosphate synthase